MDMISAETQRRWRRLHGEMSPRRVTSFGHTGAAVVESNTYRAH